MCIHKYIHVVQNQRQLHQQQHEEDEDTVVEDVWQPVKSCCQGCNEGKDFYWGHVALLQEHRQGQGQAQIAHWNMQPIAVDEVGIGDPSLHVIEYNEHFVLRCRICKVIKKLSEWQWRCPLHMNKFVHTDTWKDVYLQCPNCCGARRDENEVVEDLEERSGNSGDADTGDSEHGEKEKEKEYYWWRALSFEYDFKKEKWRLVCEASNTIPSLEQRLRRKGRGGKRGSVGIHDAGWSTFSIGDDYEFGLSTIVWRCPECCED